MRIDPLGKSELSLTPIGLGTWAIGGEWAHGWGPQEDKDSIATIHEAIELGINWIDTAPIYGLGHAERVINQALSAHRGRVQIASKVGLRWRRKGKIYPSLTPASIREEIEASLRRLGTETIDLYQIHWPLPDRDLESAWTTLAQLVTEGKIRSAGVSNFNTEQLSRVQELHTVASTQIPYNLLDRRAESTTLGYCAANGIATIAYSPLASGLLSGAFDSERLRQLPITDWRRYDPHFKEPHFTSALALVDALSSMAADSKRSVAELAIAWILCNPDVKTVVVGARHPGQLAETTRAVGNPITPEEFTALSDIAARFAALPSISAH